MSIEYGDVIVLTDEEGNEFELEYLDAMEFEGAEYRAFTPVTPENEDEMEIAVMMLEGTDEDGEEILVTIEDEELLERVYDAFILRLEAEEDGDDEEEEAE